MLGQIVVGNILRIMFVDDEIDGKGAGGARLSVVTFEVKSWKQ